MPGSGVIRPRRRVDGTYRYLSESTVSEEETDPLITLSTCGGPSPNPYFFSGFLARPQLAAAALLTVSKVSGSRFFTPAAMRDAAIRAADPVVTSDGRRLRFESFSLCGGVYCRADFLEGSLGDGFVTTGTTNVDFNSGIRNRLSSIGAAEAAHLAVGADELVLSTMQDRLVERRVSLSDRWLRGFGEVQIAQTRMSLRLALDAVSTKRLLSTMARTRGRGDWWINPQESTFTLARESAATTLRLAGLERFRLLSDHARHACSLRLWATDEESPSTAWEIDLPDLRLTFVVSPDVNRGFSGEGSVLLDVSDEGVVDGAEWLKHQLDPGRDIDIGEVARRFSMDAQVLRRFVNVLASTGSAGYDLTDGRFFHRQLPFSKMALASLHPRLRSSRALAEGSVRVISAGTGSVVATVRGVHDTYIVRMDQVSFACTCPWYTENRDERGPCKHVLAVRQVVGSE